MDGGVWERVSASIARHSKEEECLQAYTTDDFQGGYSAHSSGCKKGSAAFKNNLERTLPAVFTHQLVIMDNPCRKGGKTKHTQLLSVVGRSHSDHPHDRLFFPSDAS